MKNDLQAIQDSGRALGWLEKMLLDGLVAGAAMCIFSVLWLLWGFLMPLLWSQGPKEITRPAYAIFTGGLLLASVLLEFRRRKRAQSKS